FAPAGPCQLVFSGAGRSSGVSAGSHSAHLGVPSELYLTPCDGSSITTITETFDDVTPAWSNDASRIAFVLGGAVSVLTVASRDVRRLAADQPFSYGEPVWLH